jgi:hypothetical protein
MSGNQLNEVFETLAQKKLTSRDKQVIWANLERQFKSASVTRNHVRKMRFRASSLAPLGAAALFLCASGLLVHQSLQTPPRVDTSSTHQLAKRSDLPVTYRPAPAMWHGFRVAMFPTHLPSQDWYEVSRSVAMPLNPKFQSFLLKQPNTKIYSLEQSRRIAGFPIREPKSVKGWTRRFSEGVQFPVRLIVKGQFVGIKHTGINYFDIYETASGRQVAVTQQLNAWTVNLQSLAKGEWQGPPPELTYTVGTRFVEGFGDDLAMLSADRTDDMKELTVYHVEPDQRIVSITVNGTNADDLVQFAKIYLEAPSK